ncbi:MAG: glycosyltransferase family 4 protein [Planctomycetes bacterium]|nr:glycosyltransferase family 4 protein [Planctomycetota bacterium]
MSAGAPPRSSRPRVLYFGPAVNPIVRGRVRPFVARYPCAWVTSAPGPASLQTELPVFELPRPAFGRLPRLLFAHTLDYLVEAWDVVLRRFRPDLIHVHYVAQLDALALLPLRKIPLVLTVMGGDVLTDQIPRPWPLDLAVRRLFRRAAAVTAKSEFLAAQCRALGARRVEQVRWGIDLSCFGPRERGAARARLGLPAAGRLLLSSRALQPLYNHLPILEAVAGLPERPELVVTRHAALGDYAAQVIARARALGVTLHVLDPLPPERMPDLYAAADACVSIPASDGLPQTLLEALACARPTLALDLDAYRELPFAADACLKVAHVGGQPDLAALRAGLSELLQVRERPGVEAAQAWVRAEASLEASVAQVDALYRELAG